MSFRTSVAKCYQIHCAVTFLFQFVPHGDIIAVGELGCRRGKCSEMLPGHYICSC